MFVAAVVMIILLILLKAPQKSEQSQIAGTKRESPTARPDGQSDAKKTTAEEAAEATTKPVTRCKARVQV